MSAAAHDGPITADPDLDALAGVQAGRPELGEAGRTLRPEGAQQRAEREAARLRETRRAQLLGRHPSERRLAELEACVQRQAREAMATSPAEGSGR